MASVVAVKQYSSDSSTDEEDFEHAGSPGAAESGLSHHEDVDTQLALDNSDTENSTAELLQEDIPWRDRFKEVVLTYAFLGLVAFGGPQAHVAILREHIVERRKWLDEEQFTELYAMGQGLPGPTSTQLVISTALTRAGPIGGLAAFFLWNLPGMVVLVTCGVLIAMFVDPSYPPWYLAGLPPAAVSLLFKQFYSFGKKLDKLGTLLCLISSMVAILINGDIRIAPISSQFVLPITLGFGGFIAYIDSTRQIPYGTYKSASKGWDAESDLTMRRIGIPTWAGAIILIVWAGILTTTVTFVGLARREGREVNVYFELFEVMFRTGSLVFGGEQVVLPMLQAEVVPSWMNKDQFLQGFGLAQLMPGSFLNFSSYLGGVYQGVGGGLLAYLGMFAPGVILTFGMVPFWARLRHAKWFKSSLNGVNASAIGFLGAACIILWVGAVVTAADAMVFIIAGTLAVVYDISASFVILAGGIFGAVLHADTLNLGQVEWCTLVKGGDL